MAIVLSCAASILLLFQVHREIERPAEQDRAARIGYESPPVILWSWCNVSQSLPQPAAGDAPGWGDFNIEIALRADPLTAVMLAIVTFISSLVAIYSIGYMRGDPGYWRFFSYISLFVFSMTMLVSASNFLLLYVFWEAVGLCSYLLDRLLVREARGGRGRQEGVPGQPDRRFRLRPGRVS